MIDFEYPECFETGVIDESEPNIKLCADTLSAWSGIFLKAERPAFFGDVMAKIANKLGVSGTPESFSDYSKSYLSGEPVVKKISASVYNSWIAGAILALKEFKQLSGDSDSLFGVGETLSKYLQLCIADACKDGYTVTVEFSDSDSISILNAKNYWRSIAHYELVKSAKII